MVIIWPCAHTRASHQICVCGADFRSRSIGDRYCFVGFFFSLSLFLNFCCFIIRLSRQSRVFLDTYTKRYDDFASSGIASFQINIEHSTEIQVMNLYSMFYFFSLCLVLTTNVYRNFTCISKIHYFSNIKGPKLIKMDFYTQYTHL